LKSSGKRLLTNKIKLFDATTSPIELIKETLINFLWGFFGNSIVVFISKNNDVAVFINFFIYYIFISYIVNRNKYETMFGKLIVLPGSATLGAFVGYKLAQYISTYIS
jgi:hypothetical protein